MTRAEQEGLESRLDKQDVMLREILSRMSEHKKEHEQVDPSIKELVDILKGVKFMRSTVLLLAAVLGGAWALIAWAKDHIKL